MSLHKRNTPSAPQLDPAVLKELHHLQSGPSFRRLACFLMLYLTASALAVAVVKKCSTLEWTSMLPWLPLLLLGWLVAAASLHGISLFTHEAVHGTLSRHRSLNALAGALCAWPVWQNYSAYRVLHLRHHQDLGGEHDPDHYANYTHWTWGIFILNWLRLLIGYPVYLIAIPLLGWKHGSGTARLGILLESLATAGLSMLAWYVFPGTWLLHGWLVPMLFINTMVNIRGMSQHTLLEHAEDEVRGTRSILTSRIVRFFMCNENYHLEHHLYPGIPWHALPTVHQKLSPALRKAGAPFISSYTAFVREFFKHSLQRSPWGR